jgi:hypothetical protein
VRVLPAAARTDLHGSKHRTASLAAEVVRDLRIQPATPEAASSIRVALAKTSCKFARSVVCLGAIDHAWSHRRWPRATARPPRLALVLGTTLFGSLCAIADEGPKWAALVVTVGLAVSLIRSFFACFHPWRRTRPPTSATPTTPSRSSAWPSTSPWSPSFSSCSTSPSVTGRPAAKGRVVYVVLGSRDFHGSDLGGRVRSPSRRSGERRRPIPQARRTAQPLAVRPPRARPPLGAAPRPSGVRTGR